MTMTMAQLIAQWIKDGRLNPRTGQSYILEDIKDLAIREQVRQILNPEETEI